MGDCREPNAALLPADLALLKTSVRHQHIPLSANGFLIHYNVSWMWKSKIQVFGWVDVPPGRMSYWTPERKNSEGVSWKA
jgi:hypothetical protein